MDHGTLIPLPRRVMNQSICTKRDTGTTMSKRIRYLMVGGFLGAGKTTAIARIARHYLQQDLKVGLVTNDQANDLVDTYALRAQGFRVGEIPGACFCCNFNKLIATLADLAREDVPDVILAEPVGSSADLVATVIEPLQAMHGDLYEVGPLTVLLKPEHGRKILRRDKKAGVSPKAAYIFLKQIEEADIVAINKTDKLSPDACEELTQLVQQEFPHKNVIGISARRGDRFDELLDLLAQPAPGQRTRMEIDHDTCAAGDAELSWLNCQFTAIGQQQPFPLDRLVHAIMSTLAGRLDAEQAETAHVKLLAQHEQNISIGNFVASGNEVELSRRADVEVPRAQGVLNARTALAPERLETIARESVTSGLQLNGVHVSIDAMRCFRPGRPAPTYRLDVTGSCRTDS